jgi:hypothetical protein
MIIFKLVLHDCFVLLAVICVTYKSVFTYSGYKFQYQMKEWTQDVDILLCFHYLNKIMKYVFGILLTLFCFRAGDCEEERQTLIKCLHSTRQHL